MTDPLAIHRLRQACEGGEATHVALIPIHTSDLRWMLEAWDEVVECIKAEAAHTTRAEYGITMDAILTTMGQL